MSKIREETAGVLSLLSAESDELWLKRIVTLDLIVIAGR